jgi:hypothetical protein
VNRDGQVFIDDLAKVALHYRDAGQFGWADGNVDGLQNAGTSDDPQVWLTDLSVLARFYRFGRGSGASFAAVPEPSGWLFALAGGVYLGFCRKTRDKPYSRLVN